MNRCLGWVGWGLTLLWSTWAHAYIPPLEFLIRHRLESPSHPRMDDVTLQLNAVLATLEGQREGQREGQGSPQPVKEYLYLKAPERARWVQNIDGKLRITVNKEGRTAVGDDRTGLHLVADPFSYLLPVWMFPAGQSLDDKVQRLVDMIRRMGVEVRHVSLGRFQDRVAYVVGAYSWEPHKTQLWLDKDTLLPVRWIISERKAGSSVVRETRWLGYGQGPAGRTLPNVIENYQEGQLLRRAEVTHARFNQKLPETLFEPDPPAGARIPFHP